jgi:outer membrane protein assembly factor BamE (lipoprotein component of BamABCDE complex)
MYYRIIVYTILSIFLNSCSPIVKSHGYKIENPQVIGDLVQGLSPNITTKNDIIRDFGSPSIKIKDINDTWIYLVSNKTKNVFKKDEIDFHFILSFNFDDQGNLIKNDVVDKTEINEIVFSREKTRVPSSSYNLADQIVDSFTRAIKVLQVITMQQY